MTDLPIIIFTRADYRDSGRWFGERSGKKRKKLDGKVGTVSLLMVRTCFKEPATLLPLGFVRYRCILIRNSPCSVLSVSPWSVPYNKKKKKKKFQIVSGEKGALRGMKYLRADDCQDDPHRSSQGPSCARCLLLL